MKKIIGIVFASLMFCNIGFAEIRVIEFKKFTGNYIETICVDGYKFVINTGRSGTSMVQFYIRDRTSGATILERC